MGADGLAVVQGLLTSTYQGMNSDDYAASQLIGDVKFISFRTVYGGVYSSKAKHDRCRASCLGWIDFCARKPRMWSLTETFVERMAR